MALRTRAALIAMSSNTAIRTICMIRGIVLLPFYLKFIGADVYGYWLATGGIISSLGFFDFGIAGIIRQRCAQAFGKGEDQQACAYFLHGLIALCAVLIPFLTCTLLVVPHVGSWLSIPTATLPVIQKSFLLAAGAFALDSIKNGASAFTKAAQRPLLQGLTFSMGELLFFGTTAWGLHHGWGMYSIPIGLLVNHSTVGCICGIESLLHFVRCKGKLQVQASILRDFGQVSFLLILSSLGRRLQQNIEPTLITAFISPEIATAYSITKKIADIQRGFLNGIRGGLMAGYAHLFGEGKSERILTRFREGLEVLLYLLSGGLFLYLALNRSLITLWTGPEQFLGQPMTALIATSTLTLFLTYTLAELYESTGAIGKASIILMFEGLIRIALMAILLPTIGLPILPLSGILTGALCSFYLSRRLSRTLQAKLLHRNDYFHYISTLLILLLGVGIGLQLNLAYPWTILFAALGLSLFSILAITLASPTLRSFLQPLVRKLHKKTSRCEDANNQAIE